MTYDNKGVYDKGDTMSHTPGPWGIQPSSNPKNGTAWRDIVSLGQKFSPSYVGEALERDAHLIAAAPELLEALRDVQRYFDAVATMQPDKDRGTEWIRIREVVQDTIAKAKAEGKG